MKDFSKADNWADFPGLNGRSIVWTAIQTGDLIFSSEVDGAEWVVRINDFPSEPLYTLLINGVEVIHFNDWPKGWQKPA